MIPDFGESDVLHLNLPLKEILSVSLKAHRWPLWTQYLATGFPILAEGQIGTFYLPNLVLFRFLPTVIAYNLNLVIAFFLSAIGSYLFIRKLNLSPLAATFGAFVFTFSGFLSVHLNHFNLLQAASLLPLLFWSILLLWKTPSLPFAILFAFILSQQIFTGHFYIVFITLVGIFIFLVSYCFTTITHCSVAIVLKKTGYFFFGLTLSIFLSSIQLLPTIELWQQSARSGGLDFETVTSYPYPFKHLLTFINPYVFGNPANGSYPPFDAGWGIFWENTAYIGVVPLFLALLSIFFYKVKNVKIGWVILITSLLLVLGKNSPLYFIFSFPPFNFFRVPSKFLLLTTFALTILSAYTSEKIIKKSFESICPHIQKFLKFTFFCLFFLLALLDEYRFSHNYPPVSPARFWTQTPQTARFLQGKEGRTATIGASYAWNSVFLKDGWKDISPYVYFRNSLYPNYNFFFSIQQVGINTGGLTPRRTSFWKAIVEDTKIDEKSKIASITALSKNALSLSSVNYIISNYKIKDKSLLKEINKINPPKNLILDPFYIYENTDSLPRSYLSFQTQLVSTVEEVYRYLSNGVFLKEKKILVEEKELNFHQPEEANGDISILTSSDTEIVLKSFSNYDGILVLTDTHYPGWEAYIDQSPTKIYPVNLYQKGIFLTSGEHQIIFRFQSESFKLGKIITVSSWIIISLVVFASLCFFPRTTSDSKRLSHYL